MNDILEKLMNCVELGKINKVSPFPPSLKGQDGADELCKMALEQGIKPQVILNEALIPGMSKSARSFHRARRLCRRC